MASPSSAPRSGPRLEIPIFGADTGVLAASLGARRIELNRAGSYAVGGTTPTLAELTSLITALSSSSLSQSKRCCVRVMIRPRGKQQQQQQDFIYSDAEFASMRNTVLRVAEQGLLDPDRGDGFVFGVLKVKSGGSGGTGGAVEVDVDRSRELVRLAAPFRCVFHRAFDDLFAPAAGVRGGDGDGSDEVGDALRRVKGAGFNGVLTSGGPGNAVDNKERLGKILRVARELGVEVIVGGGVRSENVRGLAEGMELGSSDAAGEGGDDGDEGEAAPAVWFHSSCFAAKGDDGVVGFDPNEVRGMVKEVAAVEKGV
ncbi:CutC family protein [Podospora didyma]|uniref:Copper homeostasis protein cutC homolog n=1 Tax=Podospora didyma TaxID=330526 RepID=A0AAE0KLM7_9PEZI|nr:CutC family protein [Podospora didyma]